MYWCSKSKPKNKSYRRKCTKFSLSALTNSCLSLTQITIPSSLTKIGDSIFAGCGKLDKIFILDRGDKRIKCIEDKFLFFKTEATNKFYDTLVTSIGESAFYDCCSLTQITISSSFDQERIRIPSTANIDFE